MKFYVLSLLFVSSVLIVNQAQAQEENIHDDPFGVSDEYLKPPMPREAKYFKGKVRKEKNEIIARSLLSLLQPINKLPLVDHAQTQLPHTKSTDRVYNISAWFPNCTDEQWVYYNDTSNYLIANASHRLKASVSEYVYRVIKKLPVNLKLTATYLVVDRNIPLTIEAIKKSQHKKVMSFSGVLKSGEKAMFGKVERYLSAEGLIYPGAHSAYCSLNLYLADELEVEINTSLQVGLREVVQVGIIKGNEKGVMILNLERLDMNGRKVREKRVNPQIEISNYQVKREVISGREYLFWRVPDLITLLGPCEERLVVNSNLGVFAKEAIIYDFSENLELQGIRMRKDDLAIYDSMSGLLVVSGNTSVLDMVEEISYEISVSYGLNISTVTNFYEVDAHSKAEVGNEWDVVSILSRNPELLGNVGYFLGGGEKVRHSSPQGSVILEVILDESGRFTNQVYQLDLNFLNHKIKSKLKTDVEYNRPKFIELQTNPVTRRSIIMMILTTKKRIFR